MKLKTVLTAMLCYALSITGYGQADLFYTPDLLYVKMKDDAGYTLQNSQLMPARKVEEEQLQALAAMGSWSRLHEVSDEKLEQWRLEAQRNLKQKLPDLRMEFRFRVTQPADRDKAAELLQKLADVEQVQRVPLPVSLPLPGDYTPQQLYRQSVPTGINADSVYLVYQNKGAGVKICDVESNFNRNHADLPAITLIGPAPIGLNDTSTFAHGTAVLGAIAAMDNGWGTTGIAPDCKAYFSSVYTGITGFNIAAAITRTLDTLEPGDVLLLEQQTIGPNTDFTAPPQAQLGLIPVEWQVAVYNAIKLAVGKGIIVVEAAGNGRQNLGDRIYTKGNGGHYPFVPANNSGAIIVGAGGVGGRAEPRSRLVFSNYGSRVDLQGNGELVTTTGYGDLYHAEGQDYYYSGVFGGTSSASPIVASAVVLLQSVYKSHNNGAVLSPAQVLAILKATGKPQLAGVAPVSQNIGPLPDVYAAIKKALDNATDLPSISQPGSALIYPNPGNGRFNLVYPMAARSATAVQVCNVSGTVMRSYTLPRGSTTLELDITDQPEGIYFVRVVNAGSARVQRIVLQH